MASGIAGLKGKNKAMKFKIRGITRPETSKNKSQIAYQQKGPFTTRPKNSKKMFQIPIFPSNLAAIIYFSAQRISRCSRISVSFSNKSTQSCS